MAGKAIRTTIILSLFLWVVILALAAALAFVCWIVVNFAVFAMLWLMTLFGVVGV